MKKVKVLFIYSVNSSGQNPIIDQQILSLENYCEILKYKVEAKGIMGYLKEANNLRKFSKINDFDIVHAHYSFKGFIGLFTKKPIICSLMGSDVLHQNYFIIILTKFFAKRVWSATIVKSEQIKRLFKSKTYLIPNGVNQKVFRPIDRKKAKSAVGFKNDFNIIFVSYDPNNTIKNHPLAKESVNLVNSNDVKLHLISNVSQNDLVKYYNAADLLLLTSLHEGSPNVVKEAISCNCPVISTDVGDVRSHLNNLNNCYIVNNDAQEISEKIVQSMQNSRDLIRDSIKHLDVDRIAKKIINLYAEIIKND